MHPASKPLTPLDSSLISSLLDPSVFPHPVDKIELLETHISWVILTGSYAYKVKKPVDLDFLDFRDLDRRRFYCEEEIRLNRHWAPDIYLDVLPITDDRGSPRIGGSGPTIEYAVRMRQFDKGARLDEQLEAGTLTIADMRELAGIIADRHLAAKVVDVADREKVINFTKEYIWENFDQLEGVVEESLLRVLRRSTADELGRVESKLWQRFDDGFVRECHGDLHLANLVRLPTGITAFDCIEFSADLRNIDVACDIAFLVMDLVVRGHDDLSAHFLNRYLEYTGDYRSMALFNLYFAYRCLVRAKVAAVRSKEREVEAENQADRMEVDHYCELAREQGGTRRPSLVVMYGLPGSGKTWTSERLMAALPAIRVRSDIERKRMFGLDETEDSGSGVAQGIYAPDASKAVYDRLNSIAASILASGHDVILDAAFLSAAEREQARRTAQNCAAGYHILETVAPVDTLRERIQARQKGGKDASEGNLAVLDYQLENAAPLSEAEREATMTWNTAEDANVEALAIAIRSGARAPAGESGT